MDHDETGVEGFVNEALANTTPDGYRGVTGDFILVAEVMTSTGLELRVATSEELTPWKGFGMLGSATETIASMGYLDGETGSDFG